MLVISERTIGPGITVLEANGRITLGRNAQELEWKIEELLKRNPLRLVLEFSGVDYLDSTGVGMVVMCAGRVNGGGGQVRIAGAKGTVEHTLRLCKVSDLVPLCPDVAEALASFDAAAGAA